MREHQATGEGMAGGRGITGGGERSSDMKLFMDFVSEDYLPWLRANADTQTAWSEEVRATALVWEFGDLTLPEITDDRVQAFRARNDGRTPVAIVELYVLLLGRILAKAGEWGSLSAGMPDAARPVAV